MIRSNTDTPPSTSAHVLDQLLSGYSKQTPHLAVCWSSSIASRTATKGLGIGRHHTDQTSRQACVNQHIVSCGQALRGPLATTGQATRPHPHIRYAGRINPIDTGPMVNWTVVPKCCTCYTFQPPRSTAHKDGATTPIKPYR